MCEAGCTVWGIPDSPVTTKNLVIHDDIHMTFSDFVIDHTASMTNCHISSRIRSAGYEARYEV
jgi:hypothetical protein